RVAGGLKRSDARRPRVPTSGPHADDGGAGGRAERPERRAECLPAELPRDRPVADRRRLRRHGQPDGRAAVPGGDGGPDGPALAHLRRLPGGRGAGRGQCAVVAVPRRGTRHGAGCGGGGGTVARGGAGAAADGVLTGISKGLPYWRYGFV